jgi:hypothetical protein
MTSLAMPFSQAKRSALISSGRMATDSQPSSFESKAPPRQ